MTDVELSIKVDISHIYYKHTIARGRSIVQALQGNLGILMKHYRPIVTPRIPHLTPTQAMRVKSQRKLIPTINRRSLATELELVL